MYTYTLLSVTKNTKSFFRSFHHIKDCFCKGRKVAIYRSLKVQQQQKSVNVGIFLYRVFQKSVLEPSSSGAG